ncbi:MAG: spore coat protein CotJB [Alkaliphilus sp.]|nr:spore coat protein CotJB [Alkaliphilus sp.]
MHKEKINMLRKMQEIQFACVDLNLYLDTHPMDQRALMDYNAYVCQLAILRRQYESIYGPLLNLGFSQSQYPWQWIDEPWPWEIEY